MDTPQSKEQSGRLPRRFSLFWLGSTGSNLADGIMMTALPMAAAMITNDPLLVAGLTVMRFLPILTFGLAAGVIVDRSDPVRLMIVANFTRAAFLSLLAATLAFGNQSMWVLYLVMFAAMTCEVFYDTAATAAVPRIVPVDLLSRANSRLEGGRVVTERFAGAPVASFLFVIAAAMPIAVNAGSYLLAALVLLFFPFTSRKTRPNDPDPTGETNKESFLAAAKVGINHLINDKPLLRFILFTAVMQMFFMAQGSILVLLVQDHYDVAPQMFGVFLATAAAGALLGALAVERTLRRLGRFKVELYSFATMAICCALMAASPNAYVAALAWALLAGALALSNTVVIGVLQLVIPGAVLGRVLSNTRMLTMGLSPIGAIIGGLLARSDLRLPSVAAAVVMVIATLWVIRPLKSICLRADRIEKDRAESDSGSTVN